MGKEWEYNKYNLLYHFRGKRQLNAFVIVNKYFEIKRETCSGTHKFSRKFIKYGELINGISLKYPYSEILSGIWYAVYSSFFI